MSETFLPLRGPHSIWIRIFALLTAAVLLAITALAICDLYGASRMRYEVTETAVIIHYGFQTVTIPRNQVERAWILEEPTGMIRRFGTSAPGLKQGSWSTRQTGPIMLYATQTQPLLVIETPEGKYGVSPADPAVMLQAVNQGSPQLFDPAGGRGRLLWGFALPMLLLLPLLVVTGVMFYYVDRFPTTLRYELGPDELTIQTGWRPVHVPYKAIRQADVVSPKGFPLRIAGAGMPGIYWGRFAWKAAGPKLSLYATRVKPLVLIALENRTIGITPLDDEGFLKALNEYLDKTRRS